MRRREIWTAAGPGYAGKPRPSLIIQADEFLVEAVTVCGITSDPTAAETMRIALGPGEGTGLHRASHVMIDKITSMPRAKLSKRIGELDPDKMAEVDRALMLFLGLASRG